MAIHVLIADDEPNQIELLAFNLGREGFRVSTAGDGEAVVQQAEDLRPDIIILDWMMPKQSGIAACRILRARPDTKEIPIIMLSARGEENDRSFGLDAGADDYMAKPFSPRELIARVRAVLRRVRPAALNEVLAFNDIKVFPSSRQVERGGQPIHLGPKEFQILSLLIERPGQVFSRQQLLDRAWGHGVYVDDRTVDVYISRLRKALKSADADEEVNLIRTVRGGGYALASK